MSHALQTTYGRPDDTEFHGRAAGFGRGPKGGKHGGAQGTQKASAVKAPRERSPKDGIARHRAHPKCATAAPIDCNCIKTCRHVETDSQKANVEARNAFLFSVRIGRSTPLLHCQQSAATSGRVLQLGAGIEDDADDDLDERLGELAGDRVRGGSGKGPRHLQTKESKREVRALRYRDERFTEAGER